MNRDYIVEKHLLTRSFDSVERIEALLDERYNISGGQKPYIMFSGKPETASKKVSLASTRGERNVITKERRANTRIDLKKYIKQTMNNQKKLAKKVQAHTRTNNQKPFPIKKMLVYYQIPEFEDFVPLNSMWQKYIQELLFPNSTIPSLSVILPRLSSADFNGCLVTVLQSKNRNLVGMRGIIAADMQHSFVMCVPREGDSKEWKENEGTSPSQTVGGFRIVAKKGSLFGFDVIVPSKDGEDECIGFTVIGSRFAFRSSDRSGKKFKNHNVDDII